MRASAPRAPALARRAAAVLAAAVLAACAERDSTPAAEGATPAAPAQGSARPELVAALRTARDAPRHAADGAGRAWLEEDAPRSVPAGSLARFALRFEVGPLGIAEGGALLFQPSTFWGWSPPQSFEPRAEGFVEAHCDAPGVQLEPEIVERGRLALRVRGRALRAGETLRIVYGAGERGARVDRYAEREERLWLFVDGDGDGAAQPLAGSPRVEITAGPPAHLVCVAPSVVVPGERFLARFALLDALANARVAPPAGAEGFGELALTLPEGLEGPASVALDARGIGALELVARAEGVHVLAARWTRGELVLEARSNPIAVERGPRVLWGDLHGHSALSDGSGTPEDWYAYAREVAGLDVAALTDHDHWGIEALDEHPELVERLRAAARDAHEPGRFVTLFGYEWTSWIFGHRTVLCFADEGPFVSSLAEASDEPRELWAALRGHAALTIPHHVAGGPIAIDWSVAPDPELEPVCEIVSAHGVSEAFDAPWRIYSSVEGCFARDALARGYRLGFVGSGDGHDGHPGLTALGPDYPTGGLAAIVAPEATREAVLAALRARRCYATSGARILVRCTLAGHPMGSRIPAAELAGGASLVVRAVGTRPLARIELVRDGAVAGSFPGDGRAELLLGAPLEDLRAGESVYVRIVQTELAGGADGGMAWTSPFFVE